MLGFDAAQLLWLVVALAVLGVLLYQIVRLRRQVRRLRHVYLQFSDWASGAIDETCDSLIAAAGTDPDGESSIYITEEYVEEIRKDLIERWITQNGYSAQHMGELGLLWFGEKDSNDFFNDMMHGNTERGLAQKERVMELLRKDRS